MQWPVLVVSALAAAVISEFRANALALLVVIGAVGLVIQRLHARVERLEAELKKLQAAEKAAPDAPLVKPPPARVAPAAPALQPAASPAATDLVPAPRAEHVPAAAAEQAVEHVPVPEVEEQSTRITSSVGQSVLAWFHGGNTIVRIGVVILFIGVAFLLRFAAEHALLPIELRLAGVALGGAAMTVVGWRLRESRRGYGLSLQGAGIGVLYLVIFAAFRLYGLVPPPLAFGLLLLLSGVTALLAMKQDALALAVLAFGGGFLAPVFASTGQGSHVALFSYYLVLNVTIAWIASRQAWKLLNLVGFVFTFVIGTAWGLHSYEPALYASTQLFLALHFILYLFVCVQYSRQLVSALDEARLRYVDGGLLFGLPIVAFGLQAGIVKHLPYGLGVSAAVLSAVYLLLGRWLWQRAGAALRLLTEGLFALGVVFLVLVTPLTLDARWTGAAWAVQGAGLLWIALRQQRGWAAGMGLVLQLLAAAAFWERPREAELAPILNAHLLGALLLGGSALVSAWLLRPADALPWPGASRPIEPRWLHALQWVMGAAGLLQLYLGLWDEAQSLDAPTLDAAWRAVLLLAVLAALAEAAQQRLRWPELGVGGRALAAAAVLTSLERLLSSAWAPHALYLRFFSHAGWLELLAVLGVALWIQRRLQRDGSGWRRSLGAEHLLLGWYAMVQGSLQLYALAAVQVARHEAWTSLALIALPTALAWWIVRQSQRGAWPAAAHPEAWRNGLLWPWLALLVPWSLLVNLFSDGGMQPLPYLPLLNPVDIGHALGLLFALRAWRAGLLALPPLAIGGAVTGFVWLTSALVRSLHHWAGTPVWTEHALGSSLVQTGLTILWTTLALLAMLYATRRAAAGVARQVWLASGALLGVVVLKLFFVDLSSTGTLERIVSFLGVGLLMLVIGYVSPMPPAASSRTSRKAPA